MNGLTMDLYEARTAAGYLRRGMTGPATFSLSVRHLPIGRGFLDAAGLADALAFLEQFRIEDDELVYADSGASRHAKPRASAGSALHRRRMGSTRRPHRPGRRAALGGHRLRTAGTMAHSFVQTFADKRAAFRAFALDQPEMPIFLVDTYDTIAGVYAAINVIRQMGIDGPPASGSTPATSAPWPHRPRSIADPVPPVAHPSAALAALRDEVAATHQRGRHGTPWR